MLCASTDCNYENTIKGVDTSESECQVSVTTGVYATRRSVCKQFYYCF